MYKIKRRKIRASSKSGGIGEEPAVDKDAIAELFNQMLGTGDTVAVDICWPKYNEMVQLLNKLVDVTDILAGTPIITLLERDQTTDPQPLKRQLDDYVAAARLALADHPEQKARPDPKAFAAPYHALKNCRSSATTSRFAMLWRPLKPTWSLRRRLSLLNLLQPQKAAQAAQARPRASRMPTGSS